MPRSFSLVSSFTPRAPATVPQSHCGCRSVENWDFTDGWFLCGIGELTGLLVVLFTFDFSFDLLLPCVTPRRSVQFLALELRWAPNGRPLKASCRWFWCRSVCVCVWFDLMNHQITILSHYKCQQLNQPMSVLTGKISGMRTRLSGNLNLKQN